MGDRNNGDTILSDNQLLVDPSQFVLLVKDDLFKFFLFALQLELSIIILW